MRLDYERDGQRHEVSLKDLGAGRLRAHWRLFQPAEDEGGVDELLREEEFEFSADETAGGGHVLIAGTEVHDVRVECTGTKRAVHFADGTHCFEYLDPYRSSGAGVAGAGGPVELCSPMPGRVVELPVAEGEAVEEGQTVVIVEAMKMANEYKAPISGVLTALRVGVGDSVEGGSPLALITPESSD
jgi:biotin carboxyl carrier protein